MIYLLTRIGRASLVVATILTVLAGAVIGFNFGWALGVLLRGYRDYQFNDGAFPAGLPLVDVAGMLLGALVGLVVTGVAYGAVAALFGIQDSLRLLRPGAHPVGRDYPAGEPLWMQGRRQRLSPDHPAA